MLAIDTSERKERDVYSVGKERLTSFLAQVLRSCTGFVLTTSESLTVVNWILNEGVKQEI